MQGVASDEVKMAEILTSGWLQGVALISARELSETWGFCLVIVYDVYISQFTRGTIKMSDLIIREFNNQTIRIREDKYVCLTDMAKASGKLFADWVRLKSTKSYLETLSSIMGIPIIQLIESNVGNLGESSGTWGHPKVVEKFERWCNQAKIKKTTKIFESSFRDSLAMSLGGETEVPCKSGIVDILTETEVIEVKSIKNWKDAIGQVLVYRCEFKGKNPRVHLFGRASDEYRSMVVDFCTQLNVLVSFED